MRKLTSVFILTLTLISIWVVRAQIAGNPGDGTQTHWSGAGETNGFGALTNGIVIPAGNGIPVVEWVLVTSDIAYGLLTVLTNGVSATATTNSSGATIYFPTNNFAPSGPVIIRHQDGRYEYRIMSTLASAGSTLTLGPTNTVAVGDIITQVGPAYAMFGVGSLGATNREITSAHGVLVGRKNEPLVIHQQFTTVGRLAVKVSYR